MSVERLLHLNKEILTLCDSVIDKNGPNVEVAGIIKREFEKLCRKVRRDMLTVLY